VRSEETGRVEEGGERGETASKVDGEGKVSEKKKEKVSQNLYGDSLMKS